MATQPTTTGHALLGLLTIRSWTAYGLTQQMQRALRWVWPCSEASLYSAVKGLDHLDLARAREEESGGRTRTRYEITDDGRDVVRAWLANGEPAPPQVHIEQVLRVFLADLADADDLRRSLRATRRQVVEAMKEAMPILEEYAGPEAPFPERAHLNVLFIRFMAGFHAHVLRWSHEVEAELDIWPDTAGVGETPRTRRMLDEALTLYRASIEAWAEDGAEEGDAG